MKPKIVIVLKDNEEFKNLAEILKTEMERLENRSYYLESEYRRLKTELRNTEENIAQVIKTKQEIVETLRKLGMIEREEKIGEAKTSPSERLFEENPIIEILTKKEWEKTRGEKNA